MNRILNLDLRNRDGNTIQKTEIGGQAAFSFRAILSTPIPLQNSCWAVPSIPLFGKELIEVCEGTPTRRIQFADQSLTVVGYDSEGLVFRSKTGFYHSKIPQSP